jgi:carbon monoxide dehydrogenase subunit G
MQIKRTVETTATPEAAFAYLSDFTNTTEWDPGTITTVLAEGDGGVGSVYHNTSEFNGRKTELTYTVIEHVPHSRFKLHGENKTVSAIDEMVIEAAGTGSRVTYTADFDFKGLAKVAVPFLGRAFRKLGDEAEQGLQQALDRL